jgi:hypothetical protein
LIKLTELQPSNVIIANGHPGPQELPPTSPDNSENPMIETPQLPGATPGLPGAVAVLLAEAEAASREIARIASTLETARLRQRKLVTALEAANAALPPALRTGHDQRIRRLAETLRPQRGRRPDSRHQAILEYLAERAHTKRETLKVAEVQTHLEHLGHRSLTHGYASNALARLAEDGLVVKTAYARYRINGLHPELVALRLQMGQGDIAQMNAREREIGEAGAVG